MWRDTRYIRRNHIRLDAKAVCVGTGCRVMDRVHEFKDVRGAVAIADTGEGEAQPRRGVRVLSSIFADPRRIGLDISGVAGRVMEGRPETVSYTHLRAHETVLDLVCRLL